MAGPLDWLKPGRARGPDGFRYAKNHPRHAEHELISKFLEQRGVVQYEYGDIRTLKGTAAGEAIAASTGEATCRFVHALTERIDHLGPYRVAYNSDWLRRSHRNALNGALDLLLRRRLPFREEELAQLVTWQATETGRWTYDTPRVSIVATCERVAKAEGLPPMVLDALDTLRPAIRAWRDSDSLERRIAALLGEAPTVGLRPGDPWADAALTDVADAPGAWAELMSHAMKATGAKPTKRWQKAAGVLLETLGDTAFRDALTRWLPLLGVAPAPNADRGFHADPDNSQTLKGLVFAATLVASPDVELIRALGAGARGAFAKLPGIGARSAKVGNACVWALGEIGGLDAVGQLALLKVKVRNIPAQRVIEKALTTCAEQLGLPRDEIEEMGVPDYGLTEVGRLTQPLGDYVAEFTVTGTTSTQLVWRKVGSDPVNQPIKKPIKSVPAAVKRDHADELKELRATAKDIQKMLPAQRDRIDSLFLDRREWPLAAWRERYLDHPLVGTLARRIIWRFTSGDTTCSAMWLDGRLVDASDSELSDLAPDSNVRLWHPIECDVDEILAWREWLARHSVVQPFKQAHREVYLLTDAERSTGVYSNRFAAHVLKQHQFNALCAVRGWRNRLRLMVDDELPPAIRALPRWGLSAEYWIEGVGDDWDSDVMDSGAFLRVVTDQVRFYPEDGGERSAHACGGGYHVDPGDAPLPLTDVPPIVFSEVMRDVDLFVGVASLGNDPTWEDGGPEGRFRDYWQSYSFGDLSATAATRKAVLERLIPRLKIASQCTLIERFLVVRGTVRTYKIHLGSGNILMEPNGQYLCIVPGRGAVKGPAGKVFLPFEGDRTLSLILSKAFLLAADDKVTDQTILSQIRR